MLLCPLSQLVLWDMYSCFLMMWKGLSELEVWVVKQYHIPYMGQLVLPTVLVEKRIIDPYIYSLVNAPSEVVRLPTHNRENIQASIWTCRVGMVINGGRCPEMFLQPFPKVLAASPMYSSSYSNLSHLCLYNALLLCVMKPCCLSW